MLRRYPRVPISVLNGEVPHFGHEPITAPRDGCDETILLGALAQRFADRGNVYREVDFFDERVWPDLSEEFVFCDHAALIPHEADQGIERFRSEGNRGPVAREKAFDRIQYKTVEPVDLLFNQRHTAVKRSLKKFQKGSKDTLGRIPLDHRQAAQIQEEPGADGTSASRQNTNTKDEHATIAEQTRYNPSDRQLRFR